MPFDETDDDTRGRVLSNMDRQLDGPSRGRRAMGRPKLREAQARGLAGVSTSLAVVERIMVIVAPQ